MTDLVIEVTGGHIVIDAEDLPKLGGYKWRVDNVGYISRVDYSTGAPKFTLLHRLINETPEGFDTDHIDGDPTNNTKRNLRTLTRSQNTKNRKMHVKNTSGYKGVSWNHRSNKWLAYITVDYRRIYLGGFDNVHEAGAAYAAAADRYYGILNRKINFGVFA